MTAATQIMTPDTFVLFMRFSVAKTDRLSCELFGDSSIELSNADESPQILAEQMESSDSSLVELWSPWEVGELTTYQPTEQERANCKCVTILRSLEFDLCG